jgi:anthranilate phosphoribosyltransferase
MDELAVLHVHQVQTVMMMRKSLRMRRTFKVIVKLATSWHAYSS